MKLLEWNKGKKETENTKKKRGEKQSKVNISLTKVSEEK